MEINIKRVHVGAAIEKRRIELGISKSELGRRIGVTQQHVNRILDRETMETSRLVKVSEALDYNFFSLFCPVPQQISAHLAAVSLQGNAHNIIGEAELASQLSKERAEVESQKEAIKLLREQIQNLNMQITHLESHLGDKERIIKLLEERK
ncbi:helix-turn-helix domain-containing protein [Phocaeicola sartorii]|uniref:helix-turn-helix domain-containing protein n=1 Tax=Phocaeicola sartorii TaxID=671267 RepID=UPI0026321A03|nr:helix-turn-helix transcriptional regulator [Phocaeicola sartorii]